MTPGGPGSPLRVSVRAQPGAARAKVGGRYGEAEPPVLMVKVSAPPVDGRANEAVRAALADAFGLRPAAVSLVSGASSRSKVFDVVGGDPAVLEALLGA